METLPRAGEEPPAIAAHAERASAPDGTHTNTISPEVIEYEDIDETTRSETENIHERDMTEALDESESESSDEGSGRKQTVSLYVPSNVNDSSSMSIGLSVASVDMDFSVVANESETEKEKQSEKESESEKEEYKESERMEDNDSNRTECDSQRSVGQSETVSTVERGESEIGVPRPNVIWRADNSSDHCAQCSRFFTLFHRRHHCRTCGWLFCDACSSRRAQLPPAFLQNHSEAVVADEDSPPERVCDSCYDYFENGMVRVERPLPLDVPERLLKIFLPAIGGFGDVMPMVALAKELKLRGHTVVVGSDATRRDDIEAHGLTFRLIEGSLHESLAQSNKLISSTPGLLGSSDVQELLKPLVDVWTEKLEEVIENCKFDLWILNPVSSMVAFSSLQQLVPDMPIIISTLAPTCPTKYFAPPALAGDAYSWFQFFNKLKWSITLSVNWGVYQELLEPVRERLGLPAFHKPIQELFEEMQVPQVCHWSPGLLAKPSDWGSHITVSGFLPLEPEEGFRGSQELIEFLDEGNPPIYVGFGNMPHVLESDFVTKLFLTCLQAAFSSGERVIVDKRGWDSSTVFSETELMQDQVHYVENQPHSWLLTRCRAAIVHGGVGTVHTVLAADCVPIVVAFAGDQPFWGDLLARKGYSPARFMAPSLKAKALSKAIKTAVEDEEMHLKVKSIGAQIRREKGRQWAVEFVERRALDAPQWAAAWPPDQAVRSKVDLFEDP